MYDVKNDRVKIKIPKGRNLNFLCPSESLMFNPDVNLPLELLG
jgi:hypothetical protein